MLKAVVVQPLWGRPTLSHAELLLVSDARFSKYSGLDSDQIKNLQVVWKDRVDPPWGTTVLSSKDCSRKQNQTRCVRFILWFLHFGSCKRPETRPWGTPTLTRTATYQLQRKTHERERSSKCSRNVRSCEVLRSLGTSRGQTNLTMSLCQEGWRLKKNQTFPLNVLQRADKLLTCGRLQQQLNLRPVPSPPAGKPAPCDLQLRVQDVLPHQVRCCRWLEGDGKKD